MEAVFSIAIPAYKAKFLKECISSVLAQTFQKFELIIVNDCSPQPIDEIVSVFNDSRIQYSKNESNIGAENLVINWNNCLNKARGEFFIMLGDDDTMDPDYLEEFLKLINKYPTLDVYHCRSKIIDENSIPFGLTSAWPEYESVYESLWHRIRGMRSQYISDFVYRTDVLKGNGGFYNLPLAWASDDVTALIASATKGIAHTNKPVFNYRHTGLSISSTGNHEKKIEAILLYKAWLLNFLATKPNDPIDQILYQNICFLVESETKKKIIRTTVEWLDLNMFIALKRSILGRNKYQLSFKDILKALAFYFKERLGKQKEEEIFRITRA